MTNLHDERRFARIAAAALLTLVAVFLAVVIAAPIALSSGDLVRWAGSLTGLGLTGSWPWLVFISLDAAAGTCVLLVFFCAWKDLKAGTFKALIWVFAGFSAFANYRHGTTPGSPGDAWWFFPTMSVLGPGLLEAVTRFVQRYMQRESGRRASDLPKFGLARWIPVIGAPKDTYCARRTAQLLGITDAREAVAAYHALCPTGGWGVARAIRAHDATEAVRSARAAVRANGAPPTAAVERAPRAPRQRSATPRAAKDARAAAGWWTPARERMYDEYARRLDETGVQLTGGEIVALVGGGDEARARDDRKKRLCVRYAREVASGARCPADGVVLPPDVMDAVTSAAARALPGELRAARSGS